MFYITSEPLHCDSLKNQLNNNHIGALVTFEGKVRNHNVGRTVVALEYEAYETLAIKEANRIIKEVKENHSVTDIVAAHRTGRLKVGEAAVIVIASAAHRKAAFSACQYVINEIKKRLPIWKNEYYQDGSSEWISCRGCSGKLDFNQEQYYTRQQCLTTIGSEGQQKLRESKVLVVGAGGLGCPALAYLAAVGIGNISICDNDDVEVSNLHRQILFTHHDFGKPKAVIAKKRLQGLNPFVTVTAIKEKVNVDNVENIIKGHDCVLDCTDSIVAKFLLHDACRFHNIPFVQAGIYQLDGQIQVFRHREESSCLRCLWPQLPEENCIGTCAEVGVIGAVPGVLGSMQAMETIKVILEWEKVLDEESVFVDLSSCSVSKVHRQKNPQCPMCGSHPTITAIVQHHYQPPQHDWELNLTVKNDPLFQDCHWIDIRNAEERDHSNPRINFLQHIPASDVSQFYQLKSGRRYVLVCRKGVRSRNLVKELRNQGLKHFFSLRGGINTFNSLF